MMKCDECGKTIGDTLYIIGQEGQANYKRLCPVCHLGFAEGSKPKYQRFTDSWTEAKLKAHKERVKDFEERRNA